MMPVFIKEKVLENPSAISRTSRSTRTSAKVDDFNVIALFLVLVIERRMASMTHYMAVYGPANAIKEGPPPYNNCPRL